MPDTIQVVRVDQLSVHDGVAYWADPESRLHRIGEVIELTKRDHRLTGPGWNAQAIRRWVSEWEATDA